MPTSVKLESAPRAALKSELRDNLDAASVNKALTDPEITLAEVQMLTPQEKAKFRTAIANQKGALGDETHKELEALLAEAEKQSVVVTPIPATATPANGDSAKSTVEPGHRESTNNVPREIQASAKLARSRVHAAFGEPGDAHYREYISGIRNAQAKLPGFEPSSPEDIGDAIYQSRTSNLHFIDWLEGEAASNSTRLDTSKKGAGTFPFWFEKTSFDTVEEKRKHIQSMLLGLGEALKEKEVQAGIIEGFLDRIAKKTVAAGGAVLVGVLGIFLVYQGAKWVLPKALTAGGVAIAGAIGKLTGKAFSAGARGAASAGRAAANAARSRGSTPAAAVAQHEAVATTPAYTQEEWAKERVRLEEATRRMIYMDNVRNPGHNPNATPAEIFQHVEATPALKTAYDERMTKLTELGNTLVGKDTYLSKEAFDKEASHIVAGDIKKPSVTTRVTRIIPGTTERKEYQETQAALKKVKGEIDAMRARLSAKTVIDGIEVPKVIEAQIKAFDEAYKRAYDADAILDRARNQISRTVDRINAINEVIGHFEEIARLEGEITGISAKITAAETRIEGQRTAAHTETEAEKRTRELQGADEEIRIAKEALEQARIEQANLETEIREGKRDLKAAQERIDRREKELKDAIAAREKELKDAIAAREKELKDAIKKSEVSQEATNAEEIRKRSEWETELRDRSGDLKKLDDALNIPEDQKLKLLKEELTNRSGDLKKLDDAKVEVSDNVDDLEAKRTPASQKVSDALGEQANKVTEKRTILARAGGVDARGLVTTDNAELTTLRAQKNEKEVKVNAEKKAIDDIARNRENVGFPRSKGGTLAQAQAELARMEAQIAPAIPGGLATGELIAKKDTAKGARDAAFSRLNTTITNLNNEAARLGPILEIQIPHIAEFAKGQNRSDDLTMRENGTSGDKANDHKLKGTRPSLIKTILSGGKRS